MPSLDYAQVGSKRKRVFSTNENAHAQGRSLRKVKRRRAYKERDSDHSDMDVDESETTPWLPTDGDEGNDGLLNSTCCFIFYFSRWILSNFVAFLFIIAASTGDHYHLSTAPAHQLHRLRKEELVRLYLLIDALGSSTDQLTKHELVDAIVLARDDHHQPQSSSPHAGPPSSPSSTGAGDDETDGEHLRPIDKLNNRSAARSFSLGCLGAKKSTRFEQAPVTRRRTSNVASASSRSHSTSTTQSRRSSPTAVSSPLVTRLRTRTVSFHFGDCDAKRPVIKGRARRPVDSDEEDDDGVTENPSPRRLRSKNTKELHDGRRVTPMRKAKGRVSSLKESDEEEAEDDELKDDDEPQADTEQDEVVVEQDDDDDELDELAPSLSPSPIPMRRRTRAQTQKLTPVTYDLRRSRTAPELSTPRVDRSKLRRMRTQPSGTPSDGDDEDTDGEDHGSESDEVAMPGEDETDEVEMDIEPRRLRNGKIVGEDEQVDDDPSSMNGEDRDGEGEVGEEDGDADLEDDADAASVDLEADSLTSASDASESDISVDGEIDEGVDEEDIEVDLDEDLQDATAKTLVRRRRDHLVKLCESRGIDPEGTKPQLVEALIQWVKKSVYRPFKFLMQDITQRDHQSNTSPSSGATARPPSTTRPVRRSGQRHNNHVHTPVLLRLDRVHATDPDTPHPESNAPVQSQPDDGVLLDLEGLGLEDSVIPTSKLSKLEKIGSGGFKEYVKLQLFSRK